MLNLVGRNTGNNIQRIYYIMSPKLKTCLQSEDTICSRLPTESDNDSNFELNQHTVYLIFFLYTFSSYESARDRR